MLSGPAVSSLLLLFPQYWWLCWSQFWFLHLSLGSGPGHPLALLAPWLNGKCSCQGWRSQRAAKCVFSPSFLPVVPFLLQLAFSIAKILRLTSSFAKSYMVLLFGRGDFGQSLVAAKIWVRASHLRPHLPSEPQEIGTWNSWNSIEVATCRVL